jgi:hypothetical protein
MNRFHIVTGPLRVLLGTFVMGQVVFLGGSLVLNLEDAFRPLREIPLLRSFNENEHNALREYGRLTSQRQQWKLFAPELSKEFAFLEVQLRWDDLDLEPGSVPVYPLEPVSLPALDEPQDLNAFVRFRGFRFRKFEASVTPEWYNWTDRNAMFGDGDLEENQQPAAMVFQEAPRMFAYLRWRVAAFCREHPELPPPSQVVLWEHGYRIPEPPGPQPWRWEYLGEERIGRWLPNQEATTSDKER